MDLRSFMGRYSELSFKSVNTHVLELLKMYTSKIRTSP